MTGFEHATLLETHRRGTEQASEVAAVMDGADWLLLAGARMTISARLANSEERELLELPDPVLSELKHDSGTEVAFLVC